MKITAQLENTCDEHRVTLTTNGVSHALDLPAKALGQGSAINGGELLFLALATCYCNDIYREAAKPGITVESVEVEVAGEFGTEGEPARDVRYRAKVTADAIEDDIRELMIRTDMVAEIQNTLRMPISVVLDHLEVVSIRKDRPTN